jgi:heme a synthase
MIEENKNIYVSYWLLLITFFVALMIVVGGITRLTDSGLSITRWDLFVGIIPPLTLEKWILTFSLYKEIPEFKLLNPNMTLDEFKTIFWWEYIHRLLGRFVGLFFILPLLYFNIIKKIKFNNAFSYYFIFLLICAQGFLGWYMVKSGLTERTDVSQYRLSAHLTLAFIIYALLTLKYFQSINLKNLNSGKKLPYALPLIFVFLVLLQISIGAFVSGLDAGQIYQTWPLMNQTYFPDDSLIKDLFTLKVFDTPSLMQFVHRNIAYLILLIFLIMGYLIYANKNYYYLKKSYLVILLVLLLQIVLGIFTVVNGAQIIFASMHQIGSIFLITVSLILVIRNYKIN